MQAELSTDLGSFVTMSFRLRFQETRWRNPDGDRLKEHILRHRLGFDFDVHEIVNPFVSFELSTEVGRTPSFYAEGWRSTVGATYDLGDHRLESYYMIRGPVLEGFRADSHVLGLGYLYKF